jgi:hypothetical protein
METWADLLSQLNAKSSGWDENRVSSTATSSRSRSRTGAGWLTHLPAGPRPAVESVRHHQQAAQHPRAGEGELQMQPVVDGFSRRVLSWRVPYIRLFCRETRLCSPAVRPHSGWRAKTGPRSRERSVSPICACASTVDLPRAKRAIPAGCSASGLDRLSCLHNHEP